jgi:CheY-like chemotaxis protein
VNAYERKKERKKGDIISSLSKRDLNRILAYTEEIHWWVKNENGRLDLYAIEVEAYNDSVEALSNFKSNSYMLVILDIKMPMMNGF